MKNSTLFCRTMSNFKCIILDLEQKCEDALFDLCDTRERLPVKCADELEKTLRLTTQINVNTLNKV